MADADADVHVPALCDVEVASALRRLWMSEGLSEQRRNEALSDYVDLSLTRHGHLALLPRVLELGANFSAYDGVYVALAEALGAGLVTADERLGRAVETHTGVRLA
jgi:predicted nucleic acid-binding protein